MGCNDDIGIYVMSTVNSSDPSINKSNNFHYWDLPEVRHPSMENEPSQLENIEDKDHESNDDQVNASVETDQPCAISVEELEAITAAAEKEGYAAGFEKGQSEGLEKGLKEGNQVAYDDACAKIQEQLQQLQFVMDALFYPLENQQEALEGMLVDMVCRLTKAVVHRELRIESQQVAQLMEQAFNCITVTDTEYKLYLNPQDIEFIQQHLKKCKEPLGLEKISILFFADDQLLPGGCRLESDHTAVSNTMEHRLENVLDAFKNQRCGNPKQASPQ